ncbi:putative membrane protein [Lactobacillus delbrueckii subsp. lactis CRL581]|nr:putative membrane protein [Lactobacillus delbrueckii subsp. lactis CRL581]
MALTAAVMVMMVVVMNTTLIRFIHNYLFLFSLYPIPIFYLYFS